MDPRHTHPRSKRLAPPAQPKRLFPELIGMSPGTSQARGAWSYRGARVNTDRGRRASHILKAARLEMGITRRELDRQRHAARVAA